MKWFIRIDTPGDQAVLDGLNINYEGFLMNFRTLLYFFSGIKDWKIIRYARTIAIDLDLTFLTCFPPKRRTVEKALRKLGIEDKVEGTNSPSISSTLEGGDLSLIAIKALEFQREFVQGRMDQNLADFFEIELPPSNQRDYILVAPYFVIPNISSPEYKANLELMRYALENKQEDEKLYAVIALDRTLLSKPYELIRIIKDYGTSDVDGYLFWITDFDETEEGALELEMQAAFLHLVKEETQRPIINLYGNYFSILLSKLGIIDGVVSNICRRQIHRRCPSLEGGPPSELYYHTLVKNKIDKGLAAVLMNERPELRCECPVCKLYLDRLLAGKLEGSERTLLKQHFLYSMDKEIKHVLNSTFDDLLEELKENYNIALEFGINTIHDIDYMMRWYETLIRVREGMKG